MTEGASSDGHPRVQVSLSFAGSGRKGFTAITRVGDSCASASPDCEKPCQRADASDERTLPVATGLAVDRGKIGADRHRLEAELRRYLLGIGALDQANEYPGLLRRQVEHGGGAGDAGGIGGVGIVYADGDSGDGAGNQQVGGGNRKCGEHVRQAAETAGERQRLGDHVPGCSGNQALERLVVIRVLRRQGC